MYKVLFFIPNMGAGGAQRSLLTTVNAIKERCDVDPIIATWLSEDDRYIIPEGIEFVNLGDYARFKNGKLNYFYAVYKIRHVICLLKPKCIVATMSDMYMRTFLANLGLCTRLIVWEHTSMARKLHLESRIARKYFYRYADTVIVLTHKDQKLVADKYKNVKVIPNPLSFPVYQINKKKERFIVAIGRIDVWYVKGFDLLIEIWEKLHKDHPQWKLKIIGDGNEENTNIVRKWITNRSLEGSVELTGYRNDIQDILQAASIFVLPSRVEGFPMGLIEAMSQGCACVCFSIQGAIADIVKSGEDGYIVEDGDLRQFSSVLSFLMNHEKEMQRISNNAQKNIMRFSPSIIADYWGKILLMK